MSRELAISAIVLITLLAAMLAVLAVSVSADGIAIQVNRPVHDLSENFIVKPTYNISAVPFIKLLHNGTYEPKLLHNSTYSARPLPDISNMTMVYPVRELKSYEPEMQQIGCSSREAMDLEQEIPGYLNF